MCKIESMLCSSERALNRHARAMPLRRAAARTAGTGRRECLRDEADRGETRVLLRHSPEWLWSASANCSSAWSCSPMSRTCMVSS